MTNNNFEIDEEEYEIAKMIVETHEPYVKYTIKARRCCMIGLAAALFGVVYPLFSFLRGIDLAPIVWYCMGVNTCLVALQVSRVNKYDGELALAENYLNKAKELIGTHKEENHDH